MSSGWTVLRFIRTAFLPNPHKYNYYSHSQQVECALHHPQPRNVRYPTNTKCCRRTKTTSTFHNIVDSNEKSDTKQNSNTDEGLLTLYDSLSNSYKPILYMNRPTASANESMSQKKPYNDQVAAVQKGLAWYTCGPTVYDSAHLGHARTYVTIDILHRILLHLHQAMTMTMTTKTGTGITPRPIFIMNITDVDDKILMRAKELNVSPLDLAKQYEAEFWSDMDKLNVMRPTVVTRVTEHVESSIIPYIERILANGMAYIVPQCSQNNHSRTIGSVYFDVGAFEAAKGRLNRYGKLNSSEMKGSASSSTSNLSQFFEWSNENQENSKEKNIKRDPRDFALWKSRNSDEEALSWNSPWGPGRPGWHIECSAMIDFTMKKFPLHEINVHAGGLDLKFPHHTNEIAQAEAYHYSEGMKCHKTEWIPHWVHTGHLHIDGRKMSKSLKNFITIRSLFKEDMTLQKSVFYAPADDFRLWCLGLTGPFRGPATFSEVRLNEAKTIREKIVQFLLDGENWVKKSNNAHLVPFTEWGANDFDLINRLNFYREKSRQALIGSQGSDYLQAILSMTEAGSSYINITEVGCRPIKPMQMLLETVRDHLSLVGFSDKTVKAGKLENGGISAAGAIGGEDALINELVFFRSLVRKAAVGNLKSENNANVHNVSKELLKLCDDTRARLSSIGVELFDGKTQPLWRYCLPQSRDPAICTEQSTSHTSSGLVGKVT